MLNGWVDVISTSTGTGDYRRLIAVNYAPIRLLDVRF